MEKLNPFLARYKENADFNQYWYSKPTIKFLVEQCEANGTRIAFLSTPSIYFSLKNKEIKENSVCFDLDEAFAKKTKPECYFAYDFNKAEEIPEEMRGTFDLAVIDPPFITREVWEKYLEAVKLLMKKDGKLICSTIDENKDMMKEVLNVDPIAFRPSIPNLVYQYSFYTNYEDANCQEKNPEIQME